MSDDYRWIEQPLKARFLERLNRFACIVELDGERIKVYLPNSGRLEELLVPGAAVMLEQRRKPGQGKTRHDMLLVESQRYPDLTPLWVGLDSRLPPQLLRWTIIHRLIPYFETPVRIVSEPQVEQGRLDLLLETETASHYVETKSVNLLDRHGVARFPDAPTLRGTRHIEALVEMQARQGVQTWVVFVIMRPDARAFSPFAERDPRFAEALCRARDAGVEVLALSFTAGPEMGFHGLTAVRLPGRPFPGFWPPGVVEG